MLFFLALLKELCLILLLLPPRYRRGPEVKLPFPFDSSKKFLISLVLGYPWGYQAWISLSNGHEDRIKVQDSGKHETLNIQQENKIIEINFLFIYRIICSRKLPISPSSFLLLEHLISSPWTAVKWYLEPINRCYKGHHYNCIRQSIKSKIIQQMEKWK